MESSQECLSKKPRLSHDSSLQRRTLQASCKIKARARLFRKASMFKGFSVDECQRSNGSAIRSKYIISHKEMQELKLEHDLFGILNHRCSRCSQIFSFETHYNRHMKFCHTFVFSPGKIGLAAENESMLREPSSEMLLCPWCPLLCSSMPALQKHLPHCREAGRQKVKGEIFKRFPCPECPTQLATLKNLLLHLQSHYVGDILCNPCNKSFLSFKSLSKHLQTCTSKEFYKCSDCEKLFVDASHLLKHLPYCKSHTQCLKCAEVVIERRSCMEHMTMHLNTEWSKLGLKLTDGVLRKVSKETELSPVTKPSGVSLPELSPKTGKESSPTAIFAQTPVKHPSLYLKVKSSNSKKVESAERKLSESSASQTFGLSKMPRLQLESSSDEEDHYNVDPINFDNWSCDEMSESADDNFPVFQHGFYEIENNRGDSEFVDEPEISCSDLSYNVSAAEDMTDPLMPDLEVQSKLEENTPSAAQNCINVEKVADPSMPNLQIEKDAPNEVPSSFQSSCNIDAIEGVREPALDKQKNDTSHLFTPAANSSELMLTVVNVEGGANLFNWDDDCGTNIEEVPESLETSESVAPFCLPSFQTSSKCESYLNTDRRSDGNEDGDSGIDATEDQDSNRDKMEELDASHGFGVPETALLTEASEVLPITDMANEGTSYNPTLPGDGVLRDEILISNEGIVSSEVFISSSCCDNEVVVECPAESPLKKMKSYSAFVEHSYAVPEGQLVPWFKHREYKPKVTSKTKSVKPAEQSHSRTTKTKKKSTLDQPVNPGNVKRRTDVQKVSEVPDKGKNDSNSEQFLSSNKKIESTSEQPLISEKMIESTSEQRLSSKKKNESAPQQPLDNMRTHSKSNQIVSKPANCREPGNEITGICSISINEASVEFNNNVQCSIDIVTPVMLADRPEKVETKQKVSQSESSKISLNGSVSGLKKCVKLSASCLPRKTPVEQTLLPLIKNGRTIAYLRAIPTHVPFKTASNIDLTNVKKSQSSSASTSQPEVMQIPKSTSSVLCETSSVTSPSTSNNLSITAATLPDVKALDQSKKVSSDAGPSIFTSDNLINSTLDLCNQLTKENCGADKRIEPRQTKEDLISTSLEPCRNSTLINATDKAMQKIYRRERSMLSRGFKQIAKSFPHRKDSCGTNLQSNVGYSSYSSNATPSVETLGTQLTPVTSVLKEGFSEQSSRKSTTVLKESANSEVQKSVLSESPSSDNLLMFIVSSDGTLLPHPSSKPLPLDTIAGSKENVPPTDSISHSDTSDNDSKIIEVTGEKQTEPVHAELQEKESVTSVLQKCAGHEANHYSSADNTSTFCEKDDKGATQPMSLYDTDTCLPEHLPLETKGASKTNPIKIMATPIKTLSPIGFKNTVTPTKPKNMKGNSKSNMLKCLQSTVPDLGQYNIVLMSSSEDDDSDEDIVVNQICDAGSKSSQPPTAANFKSLEGRELRVGTTNPSENSERTARLESVSSVLDGVCDRGSVDEENGNQQSGTENELSEPLAAVNLKTLAKEVTTVESVNLSANQIDNCIRPKLTDELGTRLKSVSPDRNGKCDGSSFDEYHVNQLRGPGNELSGSPTATNMKSTEKEELLDANLSEYVNEDSHDFEHIALQTDDKIDKSSSWLSPIKICHMELCSDSSNLTETNDEPECGNIQENDRSDDLMKPCDSDHVKADSQIHMDLSGDGERSYWPDSDHMMSGGSSNIDESEPNTPPNECSDLFKNAVDELLLVNLLKSLKLTNYKKKDKIVKPKRRKNPQNLYRSNLLYCRKLMTEMKRLKRRKFGREGLLKVTGNFNCSHCTQSFYFKADLEHHICLKILIQKKFTSDHFNRFFDSDNANQKEENDNTHLSLSLNASEHDAQPNTAPNETMSLLSPLETFFSMKLQKRMRRFTCQKCQLNFKSFSALHDHKTDVHNEKSPLQCHICGKEFSRLQKLAVHFAKSHRSNNKASDSKEDIDTVSADISNIKVEGPDPESCGKSEDNVTKQTGSFDPTTQDGSDSKENVPTKMDTSDPATKNEVDCCKICNKTFSAKGGLKSHMNQAHATIYKCPICLRRFTYLTTMKIHYMKHFDSTSNSENVSEAPETSPVINGDSEDNIVPDNHSAKKDAEPGTLTTRTGNNSCSEDKKDISSSDTKGEENEASIEESSTILETTSKTEEFQTVAESTANSCCPEGAEAPQRENIDKQKLERINVPSQILSGMSQDENSVGKRALDEIGTKSPSQGKKHKKSKWIISSPEKQKTTPEIVDGGDSPAETGSQKLVISLSKVKKPRHKCQDCDKSFKKQHHLALHRLEVHANGPFTCPICHEEQSDTVQLQTHLEKCDDIPNNTKLTQGNKEKAHFGSNSNKTTLLTEPSHHNCDSKLNESNNSEKKILDEVEKKSEHKNVSEDCSYSHSSADQSVNKSVEISAISSPLQTHLEKLDDIPNAMRLTQGNSEEVCFGSNLDNTTLLTTPYHHNCDSKVNELNNCEEKILDDDEKKSEQKNVSEDRCHSHSGDQNVNQPVISAFSSTLQITGKRQSKKNARYLEFADTLRAFNSRHIWQCNECTRKYQSKGLLERHNIKVHGAACKFNCPHCGKIFTDARNLRFHTKKKHAKKKSLCSSTVSDNPSQSESTETDDASTFLESESNSVTATPVDSAANADTATPVDSAANADTATPVDSAANADTAAPVDSNISTDIVSSELPNVVHGAPDSLYSVADAASPGVMDNCEMLKSSLSQPDESLESASLSSAEQQISDPRKEFAFSRPLGYQCSECKLKYRSEAVLEKHKIRIHGAPCKFFCHHCKIIFADARGLSCHNKKKHRRKCDPKKSLCSNFRAHTSAQSESTGTDGVVTHHNSKANDESASSEVVKKSETLTSNSSQLVESLPSASLSPTEQSITDPPKEHAPSHALEGSQPKRGDWPCNECNLKFKSKGFLERHNIKQHGAACKFNCPYCKNIFTDARSLRFHHKTKHAKKKWLLSDCAADKSAQSGSTETAGVDTPPDPVENADAASSEVVKKSETLTSNSSQLVESLPSASLSPAEQSITDPPKEHAPSHALEDSQPKRGDWPCNECNLKFKSKGFLERHNIKQHGAACKFNCPYCKNIFTDARSLRFHHKTKHSKKKWLLSDCTADKSAQSGSTETAVVDTPRDPVANADTASSKVLNDVYTTADAQLSDAIAASSNLIGKSETLNTTSSQSHGLDSVSSQAEQPVTDSCAVVRSSSSSNVIGKKFRQCKYCQKPFKRGIDLKKHYRIKHHKRALTTYSVKDIKIESGESSGPCKDIRPNESGDSSEIGVDAEGAFKCTDCPLTYRTFSCLKRHRILVHAEPASHYCSICGKGFSYPHSLKNHFMTHSRGVTKSKRSERRVKCFCEGPCNNDEHNSKDNDDQPVNEQETADATNTVTSGDVNEVAVTVTNQCPAESSVPDNMIQNSLTEICAPVKATESCSGESIEKTPVPTSGERRHLAPSETRTDEVSSAVSSEPFSQHSVPWEHPVSSGYTALRFDPVAAAAPGFNTSEPVPQADYSFWNGASVSYSSAPFLPNGPGATVPDTPWARPLEEMKAVNACSLCGLCLPSWYALQDHYYRAHSHPYPNVYSAPQPQPEPYPAPQTVPIPWLSPWQTAAQYQSVAQNVSPIKRHDTSASSFAELTSLSGAHCSVCGLGFPTLSALQEHYATHMAPPPQSIPSFPYNGFY